MRHSRIKRAARLALGVIPLVLSGGCPIEGTAPEAAVPLPGTYRVDYQDGGLAIFELPAYRGEKGVWHTFAAAQPDWYTGPALYEVHIDGTWVRLTADETLTLDEILQTWDPPPRVEPAAP